MPSRSPDFLAVQHLLNCFRAERTASGYMVGDIRVVQDNRRTSHYCQAYRHIGLNPSDGDRLGSLSAVLLHEFGHHFTEAAGELTLDVLIDAEREAWRWARAMWSKVFPHIPYPQACEREALGSYVSYVNYYA